LEDVADKAVSSTISNMEPDSICEGNKDHACVRKIGDNKGNIAGTNQFRSWRIKQHPEIM
jgi:hypothetical protein